MNTRFLVAVMFSLMAGVQGSAASPQEMTVEDAIRLGLQNNYAIQIARNTAEIAVNNRGRGIAGFLPAIDAGSTLRYDDSNEKTGSPTSFGNATTRTSDAFLSLNWTLFDGFRMFADKKRYDELAQGGQSEARDRIERTVVSIMAAFFNLVQQEQLLDVVRETRDISKMRLEREEVRRDLGGASSTDLLNARVNYNKDASALLDQQLAVTVARKDLNILLAQDPLTYCAVRKEIVIPPFSARYNDVLVQARERNSTLLTAQHARRVAEEEEKIARSAFWPRLALSGTYGYLDRARFGDDLRAGFEGSGHTIESSVGLFLSYNLFNGNIDKITHQNAKVDVLNAGLTLSAIENEIAGLVREKYATFHKRMDKVLLEEENAGTARQNMDLQQERYATGASDSLDFRDAQVNYAQARIRLIVARFDARISLLEIEQLTGNVAID